MKQINWGTSQNVVTMTTPSAESNNYKPKHAYECNELGEYWAGLLPKSALRYELDKVRYPDLETCSNPVLFSQN